MLASALPFGLAILLFFAVLRMSHRHRPAACLAGAYLLLLIDTSRGPDGEPIAGPIGGLAAFIIIGVMVAVWNGAGRNLRHQ